MQSVLKMELKKSIYEQVVSLCFVSLGGNCRLFRCILYSCLPYLRTNGHEFSTNHGI